MAHDWYSIDGSDHDDSIRCRKCGASPGYRPVLDPPCVERDNSNPCMKLACNRVHPHGIEDGA